MRHVLCFYNNFLTVQGNDRWKGGYYQYYEGAQWKSRNKTDNQSQKSYMKQAETPPLQGSIYKKQTDYESSYCYKWRGRQNIPH